MMKIIRLMLVMMTVGLMTGCVPLPRIYLGADDVYGTVVDAETKEPINDVIVLGVWKQYDGYHGNYSANLVMRESVTDETGYYKLDGWGPRFTMAGHLEDSMPFITVYKFGYLPKQLHNDRIYPPTKYSESIWSGKNIELEKFNGSILEYATATSSLGNFMNYGSWYRGCDWKRIPRYTAAMVKLNQYLASASAYGGPSGLTLDQLRVSGSRCGFNAGEVDKLLGSFLNE